MFLIWSKLSVNTTVRKDFLLLIYALFVDAVSKDVNKKGDSSKKDKVTYSSLTVTAPPPPGFN